LVERLESLLTPDFVKLSHNGASDAQASVYRWVGVAIGVYVRAKVCKPGYCRAFKTLSSHLNCVLICLCFAGATAAGACSQSHNLQQFKKNSIRSSMRVWSRAGQFCSVNADDCF